MKIRKYKKNSFYDLYRDENLVEKIYKWLLDYEITGKIFTLSLNNASNNNIAIEFSGTAFTLLNHGVGGLFHVTYICHDINLIVQSAFDYIKDTIPKLNMFGFLLKPRKVDLSVINKLAKDSM